MDPIEYIDGVKQGILINIEENPQCANYDMITKLKVAIFILKAIRIDERATKRAIDQIINDIPIECRSVFENWLHKAVDRDESYQYAFNYLTQKYNRDENIPVEFATDIKLKSPTEIEDLVMVESESNIDGVISSVPYKGQDEHTDKLTGFKIPEDKKRSKEMLEEVYNFLYEQNILTEDKEDFLAIFGHGETIKAPMKWLLTNQSGGGKQNDLFFFLHLMLGKLPRDAKRKAQNLFVDKDGKRFIKPTSGIKREGAVVKNDKIEKRLKEILKNSRPLSTI